jgi:hypothetical protein
MKMKKNLSLHVAVILVPAFMALLFITPYNSSVFAEDAKTLRIGVLVCLTGWFSTFDTLEW